MEISIDRLLSLVLINAASPLMDCELVVSVNREHRDGSEMCAIQNRHTNAVTKINL